MGGLRQLEGHSSGEKTPFCASAAVERFDPATGLWQHVPPLNEARADAVAATLAGTLYVCGGYGSDGQPVRSVERWNAITGTWVLAPPMAACRALAAACACDGRLIVCGGLGDSDHYHHSLEKYDPQTCTWTLW